MSPKVVYKYPLFKGGYSTVRMPKHAQLLSVGIQNDGIVLWALVDLNEELENRDFEAIFTGVSFVAEYGQAYTGTVTDSYGLVYHVFEIPAYSGKGQR